MSAQKKQELRTSQSNLSRPDEYVSAQLPQNLRNSQSSLAGPNVNTIQYTNRIFLETVKRKPARKVNALDAYAGSNQFIPSGGAGSPVSPVVDVSYLATENDNLLTAENDNNLIL